MTPGDQGPATPADVDPRTKQALIEEAEAKARQAEAAARKAEVELADLESATGRQARDAKNLQAIAEAEQKASAARQLELSALIPDLSKVKDGTLEVGKDGPAIRGSALTFGALAEAATAIAAGIKPPAGAKWRILTTSDQDLASADALYQEVTLGLDQLASAVDALLKKTKTTVESVGTAAAAPVVAALAAAVPSVLSLLSAKRSLTTAAVTITDLAAAAAVAGALVRQQGDHILVFHDDFRLVLPGRLQVATTLVATKRQDLVAEKIALTDRKTAIDADLANAKEEKRVAEKALADADEKGPHPELDVALENALKRIADLSRQSGAAAVRLGQVDALIDSIDRFSAAIRVIPTGARRSPLATAALYDELHQGATSRFTHVLLVKAQPGESAQLVDDKPLWFKDKFSTLVEVNVTYMLMATEDSHVALAGTATAMASAHGNLGSEVRFNTKAHVVGAGE